MTCRACGTDNRPGAKFCVECGSPLAGACPSCGSAVEATAKFCPECGTRLGAGSSGGPATDAAAEPSVGTERRVVSVLFADLVGFTPLAERRDAEAVRELLDRYFERASEIVARYGGTVEKFIGDAVMAVWGTPVAHEDDAERSVRAALDLVEAVRELGRGASLPDLQARAGVLTGEAAVDLHAHNQGMVTGDLVNTASRLQGAAEPGTVLVGDATRIAAEGAITFEPAGPIELKGKASTVTAYRALRVVATVRGALRSEALEPPFVGRDAEFRLIRELFHATGRDRRARLVSLTGQAGIGKSRLAWEFEKYLDGIAEPVWWHRGRSPAYGEGVTFWALGEMVRKRAGVAEGDDEATTRGRIADTVAEHVAAPDERALVEPALLALLGLADAPAGGRDRLFAGWRLFLERLSESSTVALVFEDIHWADDGLLDFIDHLLEWSRSYPIYVVTLARPELLDRRPTWGAGGRSASSLALGPLAEAEMRELLAGLVRGLSEPATRAILARADGIPLYAVETVRMLVADGRLEAAEDGTYRPTGRLTDLEVPATLQALIAARLDGLDPADRALLQHASVLGKTFTAEALAAVSGQSAEEVVARLRSLVARELLVLDTDPASPERGQYGFVQALIREVAYSTLARRERRTRHLAAARYFESRGEDELAPVLASHYLDAYRAAPEGPEGQALAAQARIALRAAADRAMALGSYRAVVAALEASLELGTGEAADEAALHEQAGVAADLDGQYERARSHLIQALEHWRVARDHVRIGRTVAGLALTLSNAGQGDDAERVLEDARAELADVPDGEIARAPVIARMGQLHIRAGNSQGALAIIDEALVVAERIGDRELFVDALITKGSALGQAGRVMEGAVILDGAQQLATDLGLVDHQLRAMNNAAVVRYDLDLWRAYEIAREAVARASRYGLQSTLVYAVANTAEIGILLGEWSAVEELIIASLSPDADRADRIAMLSQLAILARLRGRLDDPSYVEFTAGARDAQTGAIAWFRTDLALVHGFIEGDLHEVERLALARAREDDQNATSAYPAAARAALWRGDLDALRAIASECAALGRPQPYAVAQLAAVQAAGLALEGRRDEARQRYRAALAGLDELRVTFAAAVTRLDAARALGPETPDGARYAAEAREVFERLDARGYLGVLDRLTSGGSHVAKSDRRVTAGPRTEVTPA